MFTNSQSLKLKFFELSALVDIYKPDIVGIKETWFNSSIPESEYNLVGFHKPVRQDRKDTSDGRGGGVLLYISNDLEFEQIFPPDAELFTNSVWAEIKQKNGRNVNIGLVYRSPNSCQDNDAMLCSTLRNLSHKDLIVFGDFNYPGVNWQSLDTQGKQASEFLDAVMDGYLTQHVNFPTRGENVLDLILSSDENMVSNMADAGKLGGSDHIMITFDATVKKTIMRVIS